MKGYIVNTSELVIYFPEGDTLTIADQGSTALNSGIFSYSTDTYQFKKVEKFVGLELIDTSGITSFVALFRGIGSGVDTSGWSESDYDFWDLSLWDVSSATILQTMFHSVKILGKVNLRGWVNNTSAVNFMFYGCSNLKTIYVSEGYDLSGVTNTASMFLGCTSLVGGNGTTYSDSYIDGQRARADKSGQAGYFTSHFNHKVCGVTGTCQHTQMSSHEGIITSWTPVNAGISVEDFITLVAAPGTKYLYLNSDIGAKGLAYSVTANGPTYICLNGYNIYDITFDSMYDVNITNCNEINSTIYQSPSNNDPLLNMSYVQTRFIAGVNNNITIDTKRLANSSVSGDYNLYIYGVNIIKSEDQSFSDASFINGSNSRSPIVYMEKASVSNLKVGLFVNKPAIKLKDSSFDNCTFEDKFINAERDYIAYETVSRVSTDFSGTVNIKNSTIGTFVYNGAQELRISGNVEISKSTSTKNEIIKNNSGTARQGASGTTTIPYRAIMGLNTDATLNIHDCTWVREDSASNMFVMAIETTSSPSGGYTSVNDLTVNGNFYFRNNNIKNINEATSYICGIKVSDKSYGIGAGITDMSGNTTDASDALKTSDPIKTSFIDVVSNKTNGIMSRATSTKLNSKQRINILFTESSGTGTIIENWTSSAVDTDYVYDAYQIFRPVTLGTTRRNYVTNIYNQTVRIVNGETHSHKICGIDGSTDCAHTLVSAHTDTITYEPLYGGTWTVAKFNEMMSTSSNRYFYLLGSVRAEGNIQVSYISRLCLNGYSITGVNFSSNNEMAICNCQTTTSTISNDGTYRFKEGYLYVYGNNKNIEIKTNYLSKLEPDGTGFGNDTTYRKVSLYDINLKPYSSEQTNKNIINSTGAAFACLEKVDIQDIKSARLINQAAGILKDVNVTNCVFTYTFIDSTYIHPGSGLTHRSLNIGQPSLSGNINISSVSMESLFGIKGLDMTVDGNVNVEDCTFTGQGIFRTSVSSFRWQISPYQYGYMNYEATLTLTEDGSINISNNTVNKYDGIMYVFRVGSEQGSYGQGELKSLKLSILGEFTYTNNKYVGVTAESSAYIAGIYMSE